MSRTVPRFLKLTWLVLRAYAFNLFVLATTTINTVTGGDPGETLSSRLGKGKLSGKPVHTLLSRLVDLTFETLFSETDHCLKSIQHDEGRRAISEVIDRHKADEPQLWRL